MVGRIMALPPLKGAYVRVPGTSEHGTRCGQDVFADVRAQMLRWGDFPGFSGWAPGNHMSS